MTIAKQRGQARRELMTGAGRARDQRQGRLAAAPS
jgi:hypothetical protein